MPSPRNTVDLDFVFHFEWTNLCEWTNCVYPHGKKMHVKEFYVIFIHLFDSGILLIIDLNKKKKGGGGEFY
jgi:hypothetical protein